MSRLLASLLIAALALPQVAIAAPREGPPPPPEGPPPPPERERPKQDPIGTLSEQGSRRGGLEFGLGSLLGATAVGLAVFGTVQLIRAREHVDFCREDPMYIDETSDPTGIDPCRFDPPSLGFASAALSWTFSAALLTGSALLFVRGGRVLGDARAYERGKLSLAPWWHRRGGGASLTLRF